MINTFSAFTPSGRRNIPRYLYHLTSKNNYASILKDGVIKRHHDVLVTSDLCGVFMFDMINFIKRWCNTGIGLKNIDTGLTEGNVSLAQALLLSVAHKNPDIVLLKIPTQNLDLKKLRCRVQELHPAKSIEHEKYGDFATNQKHYTRKKSAIEYIYEGEIPSHNFTKIGEATNTFSLEKHPAMSAILIKPLKLLEQLVKNQPEQKSVELAQKSSFTFKELI